VKKLILLLVVLPLLFTGCKDTVVELPVSDFSFVENGTFAPSKVTFSNSSKYGNTYSWNFGDGQTASTENTTHVFNTGGTYNVTLTTKNSDNKISIINKTVVIKNAPTKLKINSITILEVPFINPKTGAGWDATNGPDLFFDFEDSNYSSLFSTNRNDDVISSSLPITSTGGFPYTIDYLDTTYKIALYDYDPTLAFNDLIYIGSFNPKSYLSLIEKGEPYPTFYTLGSSGSTVLKLFVIWQ